MVEVELNNMYINIGANNAKKNTATTGSLFKYYLQEHILFTSLASFLQLVFTTEYLPHLTDLVT